MLVLVSAALAAAIVWLIAQSVALSAATALVLLALGALWLWRTRRAGVPDSGTESIDDARRTPGEMGPYWQPGTSGFGTPGLGG